MNKATKIYYVKCWVEDIDKEYIERCFEHKCEARHYCKKMNECSDSCIYSYEEVMLY